MRGNRVLSDYGAVHYANRYALAGLAMPLGALRASLTLLGARPGTKTLGRSSRAFTVPYSRSWAASGWCR